MMKTTNKATALKKMIKACSASLFSAALLGLPGLASAKVTNYGEMVDVPSGSFTMGCLNSNDDICYYAEDEKAHKVYLNAYKIDKYEVTFARYKKCLDAGKCSPLAVGGSMNFGRKGVDNFPINGVTWHQAKAFCEFEGKRLPTEAEWEKAARGTDGRKYPWGNQKPTCDLAVMDSQYAGNLGCGTGNVMDVGSKPKGASPYGAMDMAGNVWEWTADWHSNRYYHSSPENNPQGPSSGVYKTTRGSDFFARAYWELRSTSRFPYYPNNVSPAIGVRCAKSA
ncbi:formylglycine-generating enzyme family protein [Endozoicomonas arenosclerae]|uniref:formylglycine-generating enzyme family protein n=1 Tax=Endozoicomonas arenosclerae TaxID=1633495 RepID=UPI000780BAFD|nr:formylglycine-generating enzyme family protein [Endozoicomonas arenosclerae]